ncbi:SGNH/GDSL hydrolase family protein [Elioraea rosea]|uniref:SGNH/GDSL hydrolase family protein n=1 Tax=Elioraea rosea TaxID=2492390 RepID=UPI00118379BB|nr:GDSL-type esterase/lipase family protein [Elioraea rosea]
MIGCRRLIAALAALAGVVASPVSAVPAAADKCAAPAEFSVASGALPNAAAAVKQRKRLAVLVLGTGSSTNGGTSDQAASYPQRLENDLAAAFPGITVTLQTRGGRGLTAADMLPLLVEALDQFRPDLVVWQSGTVDAVRGLDPDGYGETVSEGIEKALQRRADVVLMDMQFSRFSRAAVNYGPFRQALDTAALAHGALSFPRYELMRYWAAAGQIDVERAPRPKWAAEADALHACIAKKLTELIRDGIRQAGP